MNLPKYCEFYKWFLVDELVLSFPEHFHYGKCAVIGSLTIDPKSSIIVNNIKIPSINSKYQANSGDIQLKTIWSICDLVPVYTEPVEIYGEAVFRSKSHRDRDTQNILAKTIKDVLIEYNDIPSAEQSQFWMNLNQNYEPALKVHSYRLVTQVDKLIACNLRLRISTKLRDL